MAKRRKRRAYSRHVRRNPQSDAVGYWVGFGIVATGLIALGALTRMNDRDRKSVIGI